MLSSPSMMYMMYLVVNLVKNQSINQYISNCDTMVSQEQEVLWKKIQPWEVKL